MEQLLTRVQDAFKSAFNVDPQLITLDTSPDDVLAWDSMGHVSLASSLESEFGLSFDVDDLMEMENVRDICRVVQSRLGKVQGVQPV
jgi:acyl carrier protein